MKLKGWGIAPFKLIDFYVDAMSSRLLLRRSTTTPRYSLDLEGSLEFNLSATSDSEYHWVTITNSGRLPLTGLEISIGSPFLVQGNIPASLNVGESFKVRLGYVPTSSTKSFADLIITSDQKIINFLVQGMWSKTKYLYNSKYFYNGNIRYIE